MMNRFSILRIDLEQGFKTIPLLVQRLGGHSTLQSRATRFVLRAFIFACVSYSLVQTSNPHEYDKYLSSCRLECCTVLEIYINNATVASSPLLPPSLQSIWQYTWYIRRLEYHVYTVVCTGFIKFMYIHSTGVRPTLRETMNDCAGVCPPIKLHV